MELKHPAEIWPPKTVLVIGDSMLNQIDKEMLCNSTNKSVEVRSFGGASIDSLYKNLDKLLNKKPRTVILHVGTNDTTSKSMITVINELLQLKHYIEKGGVEVIISCTIIRTDNKGRIRRLKSQGKYHAIDGIIFIKYEF